jgi:ABC-type nickel/cobalt efflux system permease component RcnA
MRRSILDALRLLFSDSILPYFLVFWLSISWGIVFATIWVLGDVEFTEDSLLIRAIETGSVVLIGGYGAWKIYRNVR